MKLISHRDTQFGKLRIDQIPQDFRSALRVFVLKNAGLSLLIIFCLGITGCVTENYQTPTAAVNQIETLANGHPEISATDSSIIKAFFTDPDISGQNSPGRALINALITDINSATESIDVAMYNFTLKDVSEALIRASERGAAVRIVVDSDALQKLDLSRLKRAGVYAMGDRRESLMHNKYVIIDGHILWTGSFNLTSSGATNDENVMVRLDSEELAGNYRLKFDEMASEDKFGPDSRSKTQKTRFDLNGLPVENYFSPEDMIDTRLVNLVGSANKFVHIMAYSFTLDRLADALVRADGNGVEVRGVFDRESAEENTGADYFTLKKSGLDVHLDGEPGLMHLKVIIVDGKTVAFGSYNFTASAENKNDENVLIITDEALAVRFEREFERIFTKAD